MMTLRHVTAEGRSRSLQGFTLTEVLVVVSIISLLFSVMLPSLNRAMKKSEQVHCLANQHQLHLAWTLYSTNNNDELCSSLGQLQHYAGSDEVFFCKSANTRDRTSRSVEALGLDACSSYDISSIMGESFRDGVRPYKHLHEVSHPSDSLVFVDSDSGQSSAFWPLVRDSEYKRWLWRPPSLMGLGGLTNRHGRGCNMTFADGHGEMIHWRDERTVGLIKGTFIDEVAASDQNADLNYLVRIMVGSRLIQDANNVEE
jgi:prepilin-type N-terminal cleavage/methylation domain-containing protein/prepilin-type processing-associated H-X9-DG protein